MTALDDLLDESEMFDESETLPDWDEGAEFIPGLGALVPQLGFLDPIGAGIKAVGNALTPPARPAAPRVSVAPSRGVNSATVQTPRGQAQVQLQTPMVHKDEFNAAVGRLQAVINADSTRINTLQKDLTTLGARVGTVVGETQGAIAKQRTEQQAALRKLRFETQAALRKIKADQQQQQMMSMVMGLMQQQQLTTRFEAHTHAAGGADTSVPKNADGDDNSMLPLLFMMMPSGGSGGDSSMTMMMMAMAMSGGF
ncbi:MULTISPECIES: hypothetical protein [unclassified Actinotalea]|uniref:hypothetical protein n=1 Tax=unclassified Actinotalea TaxID=2638618 RepID=UPI0015F3A44B|nr:MULTISPECIES: hypothetical protein [unclassified Actinotalea]